jgi:hypothetical protein
MSAIIFVACLLAILAGAVACSPSAEQAMKPPDASPTATTSSQKKKWQGMVVIDNPYMLSNDRLEKMNKGGFGGY